MLAGLKEARADIVAFLDTDVIDPARNSFDAVAGALRVGRDE